MSDRRTIADNRARASIVSLERRIKGMLMRGTVTKTNDAKKLQTLDLSITRFFKPTDIEHFHPFGFTHHPKKGSEVLVAALGGNPDHLIALPVVDRRYRIKNMAEGEIAVHDDQGQVVHFKRDGIHVESAQGVTIKCAAGITIDGPLTVKGNITQTGDFNQQGIHVDHNGPHTAVGG